jgi:hypothetical protein
MGAWRQFYQQQLVGKKNPIKLWDGLYCFQGTRRWPDVQKLGALQHNPLRLRITVTLIIADGLIVKAVRADRCYCNAFKHKVQVNNIKKKDQEGSANVRRKGSSNPSFVTKSCACASIGVLQGIISWSVDSEVCGRNAEPRYFKYTVYTYYNYTSDFRCFIVRF